MGSGIVRTLTILLGMGVAICANAQAVPGFTISTVAGGNKAGFSGDGGDARTAQLNGPSAVALSSTGELYIADCRNNRIRHVSTSGIITTVMGSGENQWQAEDKPALETNLSEAYGLTLDNNDTLYVVNRGHSKLLRLDPDGVARRIAGTGEPGFSGDGGPATDAQIHGGNHVVVNAAGEIFLADTGNQRIRNIDTQGIITTVAGNGEAAFAGDGGPATEASFNVLSALALDAQGNLYAADFSNHRIRRITPDGSISTIAGTGKPKYNGDAIPATEANIGEPCGVAVDAEGNVFIGDQVNRSVRMVTPDGLIHTIAGNGKGGYVGDDDSPATEARLLSPDILCLDPEGNLYFPDFANHAVRKLTRVTGAE